MDNTKVDNMENHDDCQYCQEVAGNEDLEHCQYCHEAEAAEGEPHCQYCAEADAEAGADHEHTGDDCEYCREAEAAAPDHEHTGDDCQYCQEAAQQGDEADDSQDFAGADLNPPGIDKPTGEEPAPGLGAGTEDVESPSNAVLDQAPAAAALPAEEESIYNPDENSKEAMQAIVSELDGGTPGESEAGAMNQIDADQMPVGNEMEGNVSRPDAYGENTPDDMGLAEGEVPQEDGPDLSGVLQEGLDSHADNINREKVVQMIGQALEGFKASKEVLERAKDQAPQLYQSSIAMLKAMIEMAKMLGLGEDVEQEAPGAQQELDDEQSPEDQKPAHFAQPSEQEAPPEEGGAESESQKPAHFAKPAPKEGADPGKKPVGQSASQ